MGTRAVPADSVHYVLGVFPHVLPSGISTRQVDFDRRNNVCKETLKKYTNPEKPYVRTGDEVWLGTGGQRSSQPVRSSEISPLDVSKPDGARGSVGESGPSNNSQAPFVMGTGISVPGKDQERDFDGILFKENIRAPPIAESFRAARLGSPFRFQPSTRETPPASSMPRSSLPGPSGILTTDPGRRASASQAVMTLVSSSLSTSLATPVQTDAEKLRREPYPSAAKLPSERAREHVPRQESDKDSGDAELKSPLGLKNDNVEDKGFLRALDSKLREAANAMKTDEPDKSKEHASKDDAGTRQPQPGPESEVEPALQLKPSLNFGTPFGAPYCGKGI